MKLITIDDYIDIYSKSKQRGIDYLLSKLTFSQMSRTKSAGIVTLASFVSPYSKDREDVRNTVGQENYIEVFVNTSLDECERRDVKGLYKKARKGEIKNMTGISAPYETPANPDLKIDTVKESVDESVEKILKLLEKRLYG